jgi:hypothetical protein
VSWSWHCSFHAEGQPDADAEGKPEAGWCKSRSGFGNEPARRNHRKVGRGESPAAAASVAGPQGKGCELRLITDAPLAERLSQRLKDPRRSGEHPKGASASLGFLALKEHKLKDKGSLADRLRFIHLVLILDSPMSLVSCLLILRLFSYPCPLSFRFRLGCRHAMA